MERDKARAFTLIEMLLVIVIIGVLAGMVVVNLSGRSQESRIVRAKADLAGQLAIALDLFEQDVGRYPTTEEGLRALVEDPGVPGWKRPYLRSGLKPDPWKTEYQYSLSAEDSAQYVLFCAGPDKQPGTDDDIYP